jgi:hypothetical protein
LKKLRRIDLIVAVMISVVFFGTCTLGFADAMPLPPKISIISPNSQGTYTNEVPLTFTAQTYGTFKMDDRRDAWGIVSFSYSLDNQEKVTLGISNTTLTNLTQGQHSLIIYGEREYLVLGFLATGIRDDFSSTKIYFTVNPLPSAISSSTPTPSPTATGTPIPTDILPQLPLFQSLPSWAIPLLLTIMLAVAGLLVYHKKHK